MEKITLYKNKGEIFKCHFNIDGASYKETTIRLCLEFENNINFFFNGQLRENGDCTIEIPKLKNIESNKCKVVVEAVADSMYFKVYEAEAELKNSVEVTMQKPAVSNFSEKAKIQLEQITKEPSPKTETVEVTAPEPDNHNPYIPKNLSEKTEKPSFKSKFQDYLDKK